MDDKGRLVLPAALRKKAGFKNGEVFAISLDRNLVVRASSIKKKIHSLRGILKFAPQRGKSIVDELIAERRAEAADE